MPVPIPFTFVGGPGNKAKASEVNANFQALAAKFTEGPGGIGNADVAAAAGIYGSKLSNVPGNRIPNPRFEDDSIDARVLRDDATVDANRSVNTNHLRDSAVTAPKIGTAAVVNGKIKFNEFSQLASTLYGISSQASGVRVASTGLDKTTLRVVDAYIQTSGTLPSGTGLALSGLFVFTRAADNLIYLGIINASGVSVDLTLLTVRVVYVSNA
jgi:hypothetical protein